MMLKKQYKVTMKTLHIIDGIGPPAARGTELIYEHLKKLANRGISVYILTIIDRYTSQDWDIWATKQEKEYNIKIYNINIPLLKHWHLGYIIITRILYWFKTLSLQYRNHYDIINDYSSSSFMFYRTVLLRPFCQAKLIHTLCIYNLGVFSSYRFSGGVKYLDRVLCMSKHIKQQTSRLLPDNNKISYFPLGIELNRFTQVNDSVDIREKHAFPKNKLVVLYLGPIERHKGIFVLSEASCKIPKTIRLHFVFTCARFLDKSERIKEIKALRESMKCCKHPFQIITDLVDVPSLMDVADIFVLPQLTAHGTIAYPVTLLEAMASGKAIVASMTEGVNELIFHNRNGFVFTPGCSTELARYIEVLAENPKLRRRIGDAAKTYIKNKHNLDSSVSNLAEIYNDVMDNEKNNSKLPA